MAREVKTRGKGEGRSKATKAGQNGATADGGMGEQCEEITVKETVSRRVSRRGTASQSVAVEIKVEEKTKITRRTRRIPPSLLRANRKLREQFPKFLRGNTSPNPTARKNPPHQV